MRRDPFKKIIFDVNTKRTRRPLGYKHLNAKFPHATVDHAKGQYVVGAVHTQTIEGLTKGTVMTKCGLCEVRVAGQY
jgi:hypothetical protein